MMFYCLVQYMTNKGASLHVFSDAAYCTMWTGSRRCASALQLRRRNEEESRSKKAPELVLDYTSLH